MADLFQATDLVTRNSVNARITDINTSISGLETKINTARTGETLYNNASGASGTITLSKNIQDYDYVEITYFSSYPSTYRTTKIFPKFNDNWELWFSNYDEGSGDPFANFDLRNISAHGTTITQHHIGHGQFGNNGVTSVWNNENVQNRIKITKVVGFKNNI